MVASNRAEVKLNAPIDYTPPELVSLVENATKNIRNDYKRKNPSRLALISLLEKSHEHLIQDRDVYLGIWVYCIETIANEYRMSDPSYKGGYIFNSGSTLYGILLKHLNINKDHQMSEKAKLYYLCKLFNYLYTNETPEATAFLDHPMIFRGRLIKMMRSILAAEHNDQDRILKTIPSEKSIDASMRTLYQDYISEAWHPNPDRILLAKLAVAISETCPRKLINHESDDFHIISRSARLKIGMLIYIMEFISDSYYLRQPKAHSALYALCEKALGNSYNYLDNETKLACYMALEFYLNNDKNRELLEANINQQVARRAEDDKPIYIDPVLRPITSNLAKKIKKLTPKDHEFPISKATCAAAAIGALLATAPGYGVGYAIGYGISITDQASTGKNSISGYTNYGMKVTLGMANCYYGYYGADIVVTAISERLFAKIFEALAAVLGAIGAGTVCFVLYDLSFKTALDLCRVYLKLSKEFPTSGIKQSDLLFITTLLELPPEVFSDLNKDTLRKITDIPVSTSPFGLLAKPATKIPAMVSESQEPALSLDKSF